MTAGPAEAIGIPPGFGEIIDSHAHVGEIPALGLTDPPEKIVGLLDDAGIGRAVVMTYTELPGYDPNALTIKPGSMQLDFGAAGAVDLKSFAHNDPNAPAAFIAFNRIATSSRSSGPTPSVS